MVWVSNIDVALATIVAWATNFTVALISAVGVDCEGGVGGAWGARYIVAG